MRGGRRASAAQSAVVRASWREGSVDRGARANAPTSRMGGQRISGALRGWRGLGGSNEVNDVIPGGCAGRLMRLAFGVLRVRGSKDAHLLSDGQNNDDGDVSYLLHVRVPGVHLLHGVGKENRYACEPMQVALPP